MNYAVHFASLLSATGALWHNEVGGESRMNAETLLKNGKLTFTLALLSGAALLLGHMVDIRKKFCELMPEVCARLEEATIGDRSRPIEGVVYIREELGRPGDTGIFTINGLSGDMVPVSRLQPYQTILRAISFGNIRDLEQARRLPAADMTNAQRIGEMRIGECAVFLGVVRHLTPEEAAPATSAAYIHIRTTPCPAPSPSSLARAPSGPASASR